MVGRMDIPKLTSKYLMNTYKRNICLEKGDGCYVYDEKGKKYLDLIGGIATCSVGHANPDIIKAVSNQSKKMINASNLFYTIPQVMLAKRLAELSGMSKCFFSNSGTEAVETAIKLIRKTTGKSKIIAMKGCFHGRTMGSLSATWNPKFKKYLGNLLSGFVHVDFGDIEALKKEIDKNTAAVMLEPIQGEAGIIIPPEGYLNKVDNICKENDVLLLVDEVQSGNGRTGKYFCFQHFNLDPDIVTVAKGIANGLPLGVTISKEGIDFEPGDHGSTFGGNNLCCAAALKTIEFIEELMPKVEEKGNYFISKLKTIKSDKIKEVRGKGLMIAVELNEKGENIVNKCAEKGLIINCVQKNILRFLPPLTITKGEIDIATEIIGEVIVGDGND